ncbi:S8 family serine peptidase [Halomarina pelagica]|uniref:S8 family serine peptidase n=1 Tax=Halomarina pelagica TaxID=2961599 RepID=UPI0020C2FE3F|nr:S8 family serine peptidase [Halomarina sp. BND7]
MGERHTLDRRRFLRLSGLAGVGAFAGVAGATPGRSPGPKEGELLVGISADGKKVEKHGRKIERKLEKKYDVTVTLTHENEVLRYLAIELGDVSEKERRKIRKRIEKYEAAKYVEENATFEALFVPNDPRYDDQYADQMVNAPTAWDTTLGDSGVTVAVVDQGVKYDHPDLDGNVAADPGYDFVDDDTDPYPDALADETHGTHVAGIAAAEVNNGEGVTGIGNSTVIAGRALSEAGTGSTSDIADAIQWAADQGADVINLSLGGGGYTSTMKNAVSYAYSNGALLVAAAGNDYGGSVSYPAAYSECLAVSALDPDGTLAAYSNYGSEIELAAPGTNVISTWTDDGYNSISGTSMATPVVAGVAGLTLAAWNLTNEELRSHLKATAVDVDLSAAKQGSGRVDAGNAVTTQPGSGSGGDGGSGDSQTASVSDSLSGYWDEDCWTYAWHYAAPSKVVIELSGPASADFDLYANDGTGTCPTTSSYDYRSWTTDSQETITIDTPDASTDLHVLVDSYSGSGDYTLTITEYA